MTPRELVSLWDAYERRETTVNYRTGLIASLLYNQHRKKSSKAIEPLDWFGKPRKPVESPTEIRTKLETWAAVVNRKT